MRTIGASLQTHLEGQVTTIATCWKFTRKDATVYRFTDHDAAIVIAADGTYSPIGSGTVSSLDSKSGASSDTMEAEIIFDSDAITETDIKNGKWDFATVEIFLINYGNTTQGTIGLLKGQIGEVEFDENRARVELMGLSQKLQQQIGRVYSYTCDANLGDTRCGVTIANYTFSGEISAVTDNANFQSLTLASGEDNYYKYGVITFTSGENNGLQMEVKASDIPSGESYVAIELFLPMPETVSSGDPFTIYAGCGKTATTDCKTKFNNLVNFRGFPFIPGQDEMMKVGYPGG